jgi:hypothetical protein
MQARNNPQTVRATYQAPKYSSPIYRHARRVVCLQLQLRREALDKQRELEDDERVVINGVDIMELLQADVQPATIVEMVVRAEPAQGPSQLPRQHARHLTQAHHIDATRASTSTQAPASVFAQHTQQPRIAGEGAPRSGSESVQQRAASHGIPTYVQPFIDNTPDDVWPSIDVGAGDQQGLWNAMNEKPQSFWDDLARMMGPDMFG